MESNNMYKWVELSEQVGTFITDAGESLEINIVSARCVHCDRYAEAVNAMPPYIQYKYCPNCGEQMIFGG